MIPGHVYTEVTRDGEKVRARVGTATTRDGEHRITLDALPLTGKLVFVADTPEDLTVGLLRRAMEAARGSEYTAGISLTLSPNGREWTARIVSTIFPDSLAEEDLPCEDGTTLADALAAVIAEIERSESGAP